MSRIARTALIITFTLLLLFPTYWMITGSFRPLVGTLKLPPALIPTSLTMGNYRALFEANPIWRWLWNTTAVSAASVVIGGSTAAMAGYAFATYKGPAMRVLYYFILGALIMPRMAIVIPQFVVFRHLRIGGYWGVLIPLFCYPLGVFMFRLNIEALPASLREAARIDGANELAILWHVVLPSCVPFIGILIISKTFEAVGDYLWTSLMLTAQKDMLLIPGLVSAISVRTAIAVNPIGVSLAASVLMAIPMFLVFIVFQRTFAHGLLGGDIKE